MSGGQPPPSNVVGTYNGGLLCYDEATGRGLSGDLNEFGNWTRAADRALGAGWTHVVGAGARSVLFYNTNSGKGIGGFLTAAGAWTKTTRYG